MGGYLGLGDLGSDIQDPNCSEARYSIHSLSLGLRDQIQVTFVVSEALRGCIRRFWGLRGHIVDQDLIRNGAQTVICLIVFGVRRYSKVFKLYRKNAVILNSRAVH